MRACVCECVCILSCVNACTQQGHNRIQIELKLRKVNGTVHADSVPPRSTWRQAIHSRTPEDSRRTIEFNNAKQICCSIIFLYCFNRPRGQILAFVTFDSVCFQTRFFVPGSFRFERAEACVHVLRVSVLCRTLPGTLDVCNLLQGPERRSVTWSHPYPTFRECIALQACMGECNGLCYRTMRNVLPSRTQNHKDKREKHSVTSSMFIDACFVFVLIVFVFVC